MKKVNFYIFGTATLLLLSGCGSSSDSKTPSSKEPATIVKKESRTVDITVLGLAQEWQKEPVVKAWNDANAYCNALNLDGKDDWRLPSSKEFFALLDNNSSIDEQFPKSSSIKEFWTSDNTAFDDTKAWKIATWSNKEAYKDKKSVLGVRCVRGDVFDNHNLFYEDDVLKDVASSKEIHWQDDKTSSLVLLNYNDAKAYCSTKSQRLPTIFEYQSVVEKKSLNTPFRYIKDNDFASYWSDTVQPTNDKQVLTLNFMTGGVAFNSKDVLNHVRCVKQINHAPTVEVNQSVSLVEDSEIEILLQANDSDKDSLTTTITQTPSHGTYVNNIYKPEANFSGTDTIKYKVSDKTLTSSEATIAIEVVSVNDVPTAKSMSITTSEDIPKSFSLDASDAENQSLSFVIDTAASHGTLTQSGDIFTYTPTSNYVGADSFSYRAFDGIDYSAVQTVYISILAINDTPMADNQTITLGEDSSKIITLTGSDMDGDMLNFSIISQPSNGQLTGTAPNLTYRPNPNYFGVDSFTFKTSDSTLDSTVATVNITVSAVNDAPIVNNLNISTNEDTAKNIIFLVQDIDSSTINYHIKSQPSHGTLTGTMPTVTYTPNANFNGTDSFVYYADDGSANSVDATVTISVGSTNDAPIAYTQEASTEEDTTATITLTGSDTENSQLTYILTSQPSHGTITQNANILTYQPNANYAGTDSFKYKVNDGQLDSAVVPVSIIVIARNDMPTADSFSVTTDEDSSKVITLVGSDIESSSLTYTTTTPSHGTLTGSGNSRTYTPAVNFHGSDSFTYTVNDGTINSDVATVTITITSINDTPTANPQSVTLDEDSNKTITLTGSDNEATTLSYSIVTQPIHGTLSVSDANVTVYTPTANYHGSDSFTFKTYDGEDYSQPSTVTISINDINDIPVIQPLSQVNTPEDTAVTIHLSASDDDNDTLTYITTSPSNGTLSGSGADRTYTPTTNYHGSDSFDVYVKDAVSNSTMITVDINVSDVNDAPIANAGVDIVAMEDRNITFLGSGIDDGSIVSYKWYEGAILLSNSISFNKDDFSIGEHNIILQIKDDDGEIATDEIKITIYSQTEVIFTPHTVSTNANNSEWLEMIDLDKDGDLDILSASTAGTKVVWYENHGDNTFTPHSIATDANNPESIKAADMDKDGDIDILYTTYTSGESLMQCINDGSQNFTCNPISDATDDLAFITITDIDKDGKLDIVSASWGQNSVDWYKGDGNGTFSTPHLIDNSNMTKAISLDTRDMDKDGDIDLVVAANGDNRAVWYENDSAGNFTPHAIADVNQIYSVYVKDMDNDGYDDIITTSNQDGQISWYKNDGNSTGFSNTYSIPSLLTNTFYASAVDMDNDGDFDILSNSSETGGKIVWYENTGNNTTFPEHIVAYNVNDVIRVFPADMDNDGVMDVVAGDKVGNIIVYENNTTGFVMQLPKTGDIYDGGFGGDYSFARDSATEIVTDSLTNLMWQDDDEVSDDLKNWNDVQGVCQQVNKGGYHDWRLPNRHELYYLAQKNSTVLDDTFESIGFFQGFFSGKDYWTSSKKKIYVNFSKATSSFAYSVNYARCVRGKELVFNYIRDDNQNIVLDKAHNLMWEDTNELENRTDDWIGSKNSCDSLDYLGFSDWRLPNIHELDAIFDDDGLHKSFKYRGDTNDLLYSSTKGIGNKVYMINMGTGLDKQKNLTSSYKYRCVRNIQ